MSAGLPYLNTSIESFAFCTLNKLLSALSDAFAGANTILMMLWIHKAIMNKFVA